MSKLGRFSASMTPLRSQIAPRAGAMRARTVVCSSDRWRAESELTTCTFQRRLKSSPMAAKTSSASTPRRQPWTRRSLASIKPFLEFVARLPSAEARGKADQEKEEGAQEQIQEGGKGDLAPDRQGPVPAGRFSQDENVIKQEK